MSTSAIQRSASRTAAPRLTLLSFDPLLFVAALGLIVCSFVTLHGAGFDSLAKRQVLYGVAGLIIAVVMCRFDYTLLRNFRFVFYGVAIVLNIIVFGFSSANGATRWIPLPMFQLQPSEFGKILLILALAAFIVERHRAVSERRLILELFGLALVPALIVMKQPDLGTGLVYVTITYSMLFFLGVGWRYLAALLALFMVVAALVVVIAPAAGVNLLQSYQKQRLTTFVNGSSSCPASNKICYQLQESLTAIGSGGKTGRGVAGATQTKFNFIPEAQDDFVFAVVGETYGFAGAAVVLALYALLLWRAIRIVTMSKNLFGMLIAGAVLAMFAFQIFLNIGMTIGVMPVTGVPLPLLSYGGSSAIVTFLAIGLLQSIHVQARATVMSRSRVQLI